MGDFVRPRGRGYSWPPFAKGHVLSLRHGAWSPRRIDPRAQELIDSVAPGVTWWQDCDWPAVWRWAQTEARIELLTEWLADKGGDIDDDESVRPASDLLTRLSVQAMNMRSRLGLDPLSRGRLGRDVAASQVDLAKLWADDDEAS